MHWGKNILYKKGKILHVTSSDNLSYAWFPKQYNIISKESMEEKVWQNLTITIQNIDVPVTCIYCQIYHQKKGLGMSLVRPGMKQVISWPITIATPFQMETPELATNHDDSGWNKETMSNRWNRCPPIETVSLNKNSKVTFKLKLGETWKTIYMYI